MSIREEDWDELSNAVYELWTDRENLRREAEEVTEERDDLAQEVSTLKATIAGLEAQL